MILWYNFSTKKFRNKIVVSGFCLQCQSQSVNPNLAGPNFSHFVCSLVEISVIVSYFLCPFDNLYVCITTVRGHLKLCPLFWKFSFNMAFLSVSVCLCVHVYVLSYDTNAKDYVSGFNIFLSVCPLKTTGD